MPRRCSPPSQGEVVDLLGQLGTGDLADEVHAGCFRIDDLAWPRCSERLSHPTGAMSIGFDAERREAWVIADVLLEGPSEQLRDELNQWFWRLLPGAGPCAVARL